MNTVVHLRKLCNHPFLFENVEDECREFWKIPDVSGSAFFILYVAVNFIIFAADFSPH